jgi:anthranilate synthase component 1
MHSINEQDFVRLSRDYDVIPVYLEMLADTATPVSVLHRFIDRTNVFLLESMEGGETWGRYSIIGVDPEPFMEIDHAGPSTGRLDELRSIYRQRRVAPVPGLPRFIGGAVGYLGYEAITGMERMPAPKPSAAVRPRSRFLRCDRLIVFDNVRHTCKIVVCGHVRDGAAPAETYRAVCRDLEAIRQTLLLPAGPIDAQRYPPVEFTSNMSADHYRAMVAAARKYIFEGDIIQVVLSQRFSAQASIAPFTLYRALRLLNPSPYTFFLKMGEETLVGSSPEVMVRLTDSCVELRPIAGTRPRGKDEAEDARLADELRADEKEKAEHVMLVDLGRNDIGRVAEAGSVQVSDYMVVERYSHVMHMVSHVSGRLKKECDAYDVIRATFPAGTLSGAPKIRAMQIIHELEPEARGPYGGAVGYIGYDGNMDLAITIRTMHVADGRISVQAGAGIVYDSVPETEYQETCHKARGMQKAVELAARGLALE